MGKATSEEVQCFDYRVLELASAMYKDKDCIRYNKAPQEGGRTPVYVPGT